MHAGFAAWRGNLLSSFSLFITSSQKCKWSYSASLHKQIKIKMSIESRMHVFLHYFLWTTLLHSKPSFFSLLYVNLCEGQTSSLTSASASVSKAFGSPKLAWRVVMGEDRWARLSTKAFLSGWEMQPALPKVVRRRFSGLSAGPLLTATLCGLLGLGRTLGGWSGTRLGLWLSVLLLLRGTAAPSDRTLTLKKNIII